MTAPGIRFKQRPTLPHQLHPRTRCLTHERGNLVAGLAQPGNTNGLPGTGTRLILSATATNHAFRIGDG